MKKILFIATIVFSLSAKAQDFRQFTHGFHRYLSLKTDTLRVGPLLFVDYHHLYADSADQLSISRKSDGTYGNRSIDIGLAEAPIVLNAYSQNHNLRGHFEVGEGVITMFGQDVNGGKIVHFQVTPDWAKVIGKTILQTTEYDETDTTVSSTNTEFNWKVIPIDDNSMGIIKVLCTIYVSNGNVIFIEKNFNYSKFGGTLTILSVTVTSSDGSTEGSTMRAANSSNNLALTAFPANSGRTYYYHLQYKQVKQNIPL